MYWNSVDIRNAFLGGLLISVSTSLHLWLKGRITGMSGVFNGLIKLDNTFLWKVNLFSGLLLASSFAVKVFGGDIYDHLFDTLQIFGTNNNIPSIVIAGLLVGFGTKLGNGCTSGHGVCGVPRLSPRSLIAVPVFMGTAFLMANLVYRLLLDDQTIDTTFNAESYADGFMAVSLVIPVVSFGLSKKNRHDVTEILISYLIGVIFASGLMLSGMTKRTKVLGFLTFDSNWDPSLIFVMMGAILGNAAPFNYLIRKEKKPVFGEKMPPKKMGEIDLKLIAGASIFGIGWGIGGVCPGPAMVGLPVYFPLMIKFFFPSMIVGQYGAEMVDKYLEKRKAEKVKLMSN